MDKTRKIEPAIVDTGIIYALADRKDAWHRKAVDFAAAFHGRLIVPSTVIPEACYLLNTYLGQTAERAFLGSLIDRQMAIEHFSENDLVRAVELITAYSDSNIGAVDASLAAIAERLKISSLLTTDRRHFSIIQPNHCKGFTLLP